MKSTMKKTIVTLCVASLLGGTLASCGNNNGSSTTGSSQGSSTASSTTSGTDESKKDDGEPTPIHIFNRLNPEVAVENNPLIAKMEEALNVKITYEAPPINNYVEKLQITMASGNIPDLIYNWGAADSNYEQWAKDGLLAELDDKIANYKNIVENVPEEMMDTMRSVETGKIHAIAKPNMVNYWGFVVHQDWLDKLGMQAPTTLEEFRTVAAAMSNNDPDGNGKKDTFGLSAGNITTQVSIVPIESAFGLANIKDTDGQYKIRQKMSGYIPYLSYLRDLYSDGSLDTEFFTNKYMVDTEKFRSNNVGFLTGFQTGVHQQLKYQDEATVLGNYTYIAPPQNENTGKSTVYVVPPIWGCWMISAEANVDKVLEMIDYGNSEEGFTLMNMGVEGTDYNSYDYTNRSVDRTEDQTKTLATYSSSYFTFAFAKNGEPAIYENVDNAARLEKFNKDFDAVKSVTELVNVPNPKTSKYNTFDSENPDLVKKRCDMEVKFIIGEITQDEFEKFLNDEYFPASAEMETEYVAWMTANAVN